MDKFTRIEREMMLDKLKEELYQLIEFGKMKAKYEKERYDALINEGFKEDEALQIVCADRQFESK